VLIEKLGMGNKGVEIKGREHCTRQNILTY
jgi:hypothetical protein